MRILLVDDDEDFLQLSNLYLRNHNPNFEIGTSTSASNALKLVNTEQYDVIVSDYRMPNLDGLEFLKILREGHNNIPFIIFTGQGREEIAINALNLGANRYIQKGGDTSSMFGILAEAIKQELEYNQTKKEIIERKETLDSILKAIQAGISVLDKNLTIQFVNDVMKQWYPDQVPLEGKKCFESYQGKNEPCDPCPSIRCLKTGKTEFEIVKGAPSSDTEWFELFSYPMQDRETGTIKGVVEFVRDITEQKRQDKKIKQLNTILRTISDINQVIVKKRDLNAILKESCAILNRTFHESRIAILDEDEENLVFYSEHGKYLTISYDTAGDFSNYNDDINVLTCFNKAFQANGIQIMKSNNCKVCIFEDDENQFNCVMVPMIHEGRNVGFLSVHVKEGMEITKQEKNLFQELVSDIAYAKEKLSTEAKLKRQETRLSKIMTAANEGMWDWNLLTNKVYFSPKYYEMAGYDKNEFPYRLEEFQRRVHKEDIDYVMEQASKHLKGEIDLFDVEFRFKRKNGEYMWINGRGVIVSREEHGKPLRFVGTHTDITNRKKREEREKLLYMLLGHDIKNKNQIILSYLQLIADEAELPENGQNFVHKAMQSTEESIKLVQKVRLLLEVQREKPSPIDIIAVLKDTTNNITSQANDNGIKIEVDYEGPGCNVLGGSLLTELFSNIIENAIYHSEGSTIQVTIKTQDQQCRVIIEDDGIGINKANQERIFEKGFTTSQKRTGLGLFLVKILLETYNAEIEVKNSAMGGARFDVHLKVVN